MEKGRPKFGEFRMRKVEAGLDAKESAIKALEDKKVQECTKTKREGTKGFNERARKVLEKESHQAPVNASQKDCVAYHINTTAARFESSLIDGAGADSSSPQDAHHIDALDSYAVRLLEMIHGGMYSLALLSRQELCVLYRYFFRTNPILGRIIDLHTDLPLSKIAINPPADLPEILKDYITQWYQRVLDRVDMPAFIREATIQYWVYGESNLVVSDFYGNKGRTLEPLPTNAQVNANLDELTRIENAYSTDPASVDMVTRLDYLNKKFESFYDPDYQGPSSVRVVNFWEVEEYLENSDINYKCLEISVPENLKNVKGSPITFKELEEVGYSRGLLNLIAKKPAVDGGEAFEPKDSTFTVSNELYQEGAFLFSLERPDRTSIIHRVLNECIAWDAAYKALRVKIQQLGKVGRVITAPDLSIDQLDVLRAEVEMMIQDPSFAIVANYDLSWQEVNSFIKEELNELRESTEQLQELLSMATGMPLSMLSGDGQYSGDSVKLEIINTVYSSFKNQLIKSVEQGLFLPLALRKGFVTQDQWGNLVPVFPRFALSRVSLRDDNVFDILFSLYQKGSAPAALIFDLLGMDADEVRRAVEKEAFTVNDPNFNDFLRDLYSRAADEFYERVDIPEKIANSIGIILSERHNQDSNDFTE